MANSHKNQCSLSSLCWACSHSKKSPFFMVQSGSVSISQKMSIHHHFSWYWPWIAETTIFNVKNHHFSAGDRLLHPLFGEAAHREERHLKALATRQWCKWWADDSLIYTWWCPKTLAKLVPVTPITMTTTACWSGPAPKIGNTGEAGNQDCAIWNAAGQHEYRAASPTGYTVEQWRAELPSTQQEWGLGAVEFRGRMHRLLPGAFLEGAFDSLNVEDRFIDNYYSL